MCHDIKPHCGLHGGIINSNLGLFNESLVLSSPYNKHLTNYYLTLSLYHLQNVESRAIHI